ncbi:MAG: division/cell wall cluster transcriptional repressor MraZ [Acidobacteriota bacterium]
MGNYLIGSYTARFDKSGRIKIPAKFHEAIVEKYGKDVFITSLTDQSVQIYPLPRWEKLTGLTDEGLLQLKPQVRSFMLRVNVKGSFYEIDSKGRVLISQTLKEKANLGAEVEVVGLNDHLEIWDKDRLEGIIDENPLTDEDFNQISELKLKEDKE